MIALKTVLVPVDFSETSDVALRYGKEMARAFGAALHVLHVVQEPYSQPWAVEAYGFSLAALQEDWIRDAKRRLDEIIPDADRKTLRAETATVLGHPVTEVLRYAADRKVDLIVMGTHGRGPLGHMIMGSVAERVVRRSPCPVLTVHHPEREFVLPEG
jgi:nucleotide-binding universal stress UspA family protein